MPTSTDSLFTTNHDAALEALGAIAGGRTWGAFDVPKAEAEQGHASLYVFPLWNYPRHTDGKPDSTSKALVRDPDGTWWYHIRRPTAEANPQWKAQWDSLKLCQRLQLPIIGVLKDRKTKRCALDVTFECGPFIGSFDGTEVWMQARPRGPAVELLSGHTSSAPDLLLTAKLAQESTAIEASDYFAPANLVDARARLLREVVQRRGQDVFRRKLLAAYNGRCAVTGCDAVDALEAAHIIGYLGPATQHVSNGLLLRADIHTLFDLGLLTICPDTLTVALAPQLRISSYAALQGQPLALPAALADQPNHEALRQRWPT